MTFRLVALASRIAGAVIRIVPRLLEFSTGIERSVTRLPDFLSARGRLAFHLTGQESTGAHGARDRSPKRVVRAGRVDSRRVSRRLARSRRMPVLVTIASAGAAAAMLASCVSPRYKLAKTPAAPAPALNVPFPQQGLDATLGTVIIYGGPGSWKREAFWDEYVVAFHNSGDEPLQVVAVTLQDDAGVAQSAGDDPWVLERQSKTLERRYRDAGMTFARLAAPRAIMASAEPAVVAGAGIGTAGAAAIASTAVVALPVYGVAIWGINRSNKSAILTEFNRRRLPLPLNLAAGETRTGSVFFAMVPNPRSLAAHWVHASASGDAALDLAFLHGLHVEPSAMDAARVGASMP